MKTWTRVILLTALLATSLTLTALAGKSATHTASTELRWMETPIGVFVSPISGDMTKGKHITYFRFAAGMATPVHAHAHSYVGIVLTGTARHWVPGQPETRTDLAPGAHWSMPAGQEHVSECLPGVDCIMAVVQEGAFDFVTEPPAGGSGG